MPHATSVHTPRQQADHAPFAGAATTSVRGPRSPSLAAAEQRYGDPQAIAELARSMRRQGHDVDREADWLQRLAETSSWTGRAADAMRASVDAGVRGLRRTAELHERAAAALHDHAQEVRQREYLIALIEDEVRERIAEVKARLHRLAGALGAAGLAALDPVDHFLDHFDPPPAGHRDWLTVRLPFPVPTLASVAPMLHGAADLMGGRA